MQYLTQIIVHLADRLSYNMLKHVSDKILSIFLLFINTIWFLQELPKDWKHSIIMVNNRLQCTIVIYY